MNAIETDVAIVGGGLIGCMIAHELRKRGMSVIVLERGRVGAQSSGVSFGSLRLQGHHGVGLDMAVRAQVLWAGVESELGESVGFARQGHVHLAMNPEQITRLERNVSHLSAAGLDTMLLDRAATRRRYPFLGGQVLAASWSSHDAVVNPRLVTPAFARAAQRLGVIVREGTEMISATHENGRFRLRTRNGDGDDGMIVARTLVNAAGAWCGELALAFGETIPVFAAGPAEIVTEPVPAFAEPVMHVVDGSVLFRQTARGNVVIAGHPRLSVDAGSLRARVPPEKTLTNLARLIAIAPHMRAHHVIRTWTGIEGYVPDMMPVLGPSRTTPGLFYACAFSGHGLQVGPAAAVALAEWIVDGSTAMPVGAFDIGRFAAGDGSAVSTIREEFTDDVLKAGPQAG